MSNISRGVAGQCWPMLPIAVYWGRREDRAMDAPADELLTVEDVTRILKVHEETVRRWIRNRELPARLLGSARGGYRIRRSDLDRFIDEKSGMGNAARRDKP